MRPGPASWRAVARGARALVASLVVSLVVAAAVLRVTGAEVADSAASERRYAERPEVPTAVRLPDGTVVPVRSVGTRRDGVLDVPDDVGTAGWWRGGARVGDAFGSTLLASHADSRHQRLRAYAQLLRMRSGALVELRSRHLRQQFVARSVRLVGKGSLADDHWIHSSGGARLLILVTCAPPLRADRGGCRKLAVVTAAPSSGPEKRGSR